jgi:transcriptional regulator with XRE-family HTH domain
MTENDGFAKRLRQARIERGMTQEELGDHIGLPHTAVSRWERGEHLPRAKQTAALATVLGVSVDYLLGNSDNANGGGDTFAIPRALREFLDTPLGRAAQQRHYVQALIDWKPPAHIKVTPRYYAALVAALLAYENDFPSTE